MNDMENNIELSNTPKIAEAWLSSTRKPRRRSIVREFALNTSTHGLPGMARSESIHNFIFWTVSFVAFLGIMIYFATAALQDYFSYPTQTSVSIYVERAQVFPAVTFCNYSPARYDRVIGPFLNYTNSTNGLHSSASFTYQQAIELQEYLIQKLNDGNSVSDYFFTSDVMLISCTYNSVSCTSNDFISFLSSAYGKCYTFNAQTKNENSSLHYTTDNGGVGKLVLRLYAHSDLYVPYVAEDVLVGMVAMVHANTKLPLIELDGILLAPGRRHKLGFKRRNDDFLSSPYTDCTTSIPLAMQAMFNQYDGADYEYSQTICYKICVQTYIYQQCGCVNPYEWSARSIVLQGTSTIINASLCNLTDQCYIIASTQISTTESIWNEYCSDCQPECSSVSYSITPSAVTAPSTPYAYMAKQFVENVSVPLPANWSTNWLSQVQNNYISLEVVCETIQIENFTQQASLGPTDVLSNVGGLSGLWIGISFLSVMEIIEMLYRLLRHEFHNIRATIANRHVVHVP